MLCEGIMLYLLVVRVFGNAAQRWYWLLIVGWGECLSVKLANTMTAHMNTLMSLVAILHTRVYDPYTLATRPTTSLILLYTPGVNMTWKLSRLTLTKTYSHRHVCMRTHTYKL